MTRLTAVVAALPLAAGSVVGRALGGTGREALRHAGFGLP